jgi:hypothetical protein
MMEDIGIASPLYDLCRTLGISRVYNLAIHLVAWTVPYPISVPWPVIQYGAVENEDDRDRGYIVVAPGGRTRLWVYGRNDGAPYELGNVADVATVHRMGPRPLFATPCRAVVLDDGVHVGTLMPLRGNDGELSSDLLGSEDAPDAYHPGISAQAYESHPLRRLYDAATDSLLVWDPRTDGTVAPETATDEGDELYAGMCVPKVHKWVEDNVLPMCERVLVRAWGHAASGLVRNLRCGVTVPRGAPGGSPSDHVERMRDALRERRVYIAARIAPPRDSSEYALGVWVAIEVRHTVGNLKNQANADMITIRVPPCDLRMPPTRTSHPHTESVNASTVRHTRNPPAGSTVGGGRKRAHGTDPPMPPPDPTAIVVARYLFATKT